MYRVVAGIDTETDGPGYKKIRIQPHIEKGLTNASANLLTYYGNISSGWKVENGKLLIDIEIPANTLATIVVPAPKAESISESGKPLSALKEIQIAGSENGQVSLKLGSGKYHFSIQQ
jgi:alpha-L-rhamnosidase